MTGSAAGDWPTIDPLDRRLNAWRPDLADIRLQGKVTAARFVEGKPARIGLPVADLRPEPAAEAGIDHQLLLGEAVDVFDAREDWVWVQSRASNYVGWTRAEAVRTDAPEPTHRIIAPRSFLYPQADLKCPARACLSMGACIAIAGETTVRGTPYLLLADGSAIIARHARPVDQIAADYVSVAADLVATPYLWGGASAFGLDCSGLVYLAMAMCGHAVPRDSDMQAAGLGTPVDPGPQYAALARGDLVFWRGHVAIALGDGQLLHANGYTMDVVSEPVSQALDRIETLFERPIGCRRPGFGLAA